MKLNLPFLLDGATGTNLAAAGMPEGVCVERWILEHPDALQSLQRAFIEAGAQAVLAPTFGANRLKLAGYGLADQVAQMNAALVQLSREAVSGNALVAGDLSSTGQFVRPFGELDFAELVDVYREQCAALAAAGVDYIHAETIMSLADARAALLAARETGLPVFVSITVNENGRTLSGLTLRTAVIVLQEMGAAAVGLNCSEGPHRMLEPLRDAAPYAKIPLIAKPNAGRPDAILPPESFARECRPLLEAGARILGGCCGSTPAHIAALRELLAEPLPSLPEREEALAAAAENGAYFLNEEDLVLGEPIPCGPDLADDLIDADDDLIGAVRVRVDTPDEVEDLVENAHMARLPMAILSDSAEALERALLCYQGRAIVDSGSEIEPETLRSIAARYGAIVY